MAPGTASASAPVVLDAPGADEGSIREAEALLRWRARSLRDQFPVREAEAARLFPVMLHASFKNSTLTADPPGVPGMAYRRSWVAWAADFGLSPPWRIQKGECLAEAVFAFSGASGLELVVIAPAEARGGARRILEERVDLASGILRTAKVACVAGVLDVDAFCSARSAARLLLFGSMLAGRLSPATCRSLLRAWRAPLSSEDIAWIFEGAPTSLSSLAVGILAAGGVAGPMDAIEECIRGGVPARALAAPDAAPVAWAGAVTPTGPDLDFVLGLLRPGSTVYPRPAGAGRVVQPPARDPALAVQVGGRLALAFVKAVRRSRPLRASDRRREVIGAGGPRALLPLIGGGLRESAASGDPPARAGARTREGGLRGPARPGRARAGRDVRPGPGSRARPPGRGRGLDHARHPRPTVEGARDPAGPAAGAPCPARRRRGCGGKRAAPRPHQPGPASGGGLPPRAGDSPRVYPPPFRPRSPGRPGRRGPDPRGPLRGRRGGHPLERHGAQVCAAAHRRGADARARCQLPRRPEGCEPASGGRPGRRPGLPHRQAEDSAGSRWRAS